MIFPPIDAIQEFSEETTDADARYGRGNGGTINLVYKSGTTSITATSSNFFATDALNARNYFATTVKPVLRQNDVWRHLRRPAILKQTESEDILLCRLLRTERSRQGNRPISTRVPRFHIVTKLLAQGYDFSAYSQAIKNPATRSAYADNFIPLSDTDVNTTGANILNFYQKYATPNHIGVNPTANNFLYIAGRR